MTDIQNSSLFKSINKNISCDSKLFVFCVIIEHCSKASLTINIFGSEKFAFYNADNCKWRKNKFSSNFNLVETRKSFAYAIVKIALKNMKLRWSIKLMHPCTQTVHFNFCTFMRTIRYTFRRIRLNIALSNSFRYCVQLRH